jgi:hypothetical protein
MEWDLFEGGSSLGGRGSEDGVIIRDEEHRDGARITLEQDATTAPFVITCGIYGWMVHTRFFSSPSIAGEEYDRMKEGLSAVLAIIPTRDDPECDRKCQLVAQKIGEFVEEFPLA